MRPVFAALSTVEENLGEAATAVSLLPPLIAARIALVCDFKVESARRFCLVRRSVWRARLAADFVLAIDGLSKGWRAYRGGLWCQRGICGMATLMRTRKASDAIGQ